MPASTSLDFSLKIGSLAAHAFRVQEFSLSEGISECFTLTVQASSGEEDIAYERIIGQAACLTVNGGDFSIKHQGVVTEFNEYPDTAENHGRGSYLYDLVIEPRLKLLAYSTRNRIFQKLTAPEIIEEVLSGHGLAKQDFEFRVKAVLSKREYTVQYNESDLNFACRLMEEEGIFYFFDHEGEKEKLVMADGRNAIRPVPNTASVAYHAETGLAHSATDHITRMRRTQRMVTGKVTVKDYNPDHPQMDIIGRAGRAGQGESCIFGPNAGSPGDADRKASMRAEMLSCGKLQLDGEGICRAFRAGYRFGLEGDGRTPFTGEYTLVKVAHRGDQREGFEGDQPKSIYSNRFSCIPAETPFRPALATPKPRIHGVLTARVDGPEDKYAYLDEEGRYRAKLPFDLGDRKDGQASLPIRLNQPYAGPDYGMHFPIHKGNDLTLAFIDGDPDRPIALGALPNPSAPSPANKGNKSECIIKTAAGHVIRLDDREGKTAVDITTKGLHRLSMNDDAESREIRLATTGKNELVMDDKGRNIRLMTPGGAQIVKLDYDKQTLSAATKYGHKLAMDDEGRKISLQTKDGLSLTLDDDKQMITVQDGEGKHAFRIDVGGGKILLDTEGDLQFKAKGSLNIEAKEINLEAKAGAIGIKAMRDVMVEGMNVSATGKLNIALEGGVEAGLKGAQTRVEGQAALDLKAAGQTRLNGLQVSVTGQALCEVKAPMVMIN